MPDIFDLLGSGGATVTVPGPPVQTAPGFSTQPSLHTSPREGLPTPFLLGVASGYPAPTPSVVWAIDGTTVSTALTPPTPPTGSVGKTLSMAVTWSNGVSPDASATVSAAILMGSSAVQIVTATATYDAPGFRVLLTQAELDAFNANPPAGHESDAILFLGA